MPVCTDKPVADDISTVHPLLLNSFPNLLRAINGSLIPFPPLPLFKLLWFSLILYRQMMEKSQFIFHPLGSLTIFFLFLEQTSFIKNAANLEGKLREDGKEVRATEAVTLHVTG